MKSKQMLLMAGASAFSAITLSATLAATGATPRSLIITDVSGAVRMQQGLPCGNTADLSTPVARGHMALTWVQQTRGEVMVDLQRLTLQLAPFRVEASCNGVRGAVDFREVGVELASAIRFKGEQASDGLVHFTIPKEQFLLYEAVLSSASPRRPDTSYQRPSEDVTGAIDLGRQTVQLHVVIANEMRFRVGCDGDRCAIDETHAGTATTDIRGRSSSSTQPAATRALAPSKSFLAR
jgi:hypothetical protein